MTFSPRAVLATAVAFVAVLSLAVPPAPTSAAGRVPGELVVKYRLGTSGPERDEIRRAAGVTSAGVIDGRTQAVRALSGTSAAGAAMKLEADPRVVHAVPNYLASASALIPNDPGRGGPGPLGRRGEEVEARLHAAEITRPARFRSAGNRPKWSPAP